MNLILTGANGFIGSNFIKEYSHKFNKCYLLGRKSFNGNTKNINVISLQWSLKSEITLEVEDPKNTIFVHTAYDKKNLNDNIKGIKNIINYINSKQIKSLIHLSTFSVYNPFHKGVLSETTPYSKFKYHYSIIKINIENLILERCNKNSNVYILQPSIVYGEKSNWSDHAIKTLHFKSIILPTGICNPIFIKDLTRAIYLASELKNPVNRINKMLLSSNQSCSWHEFYLYHAKMFKVKENKISITNNSKLKKYHNSFLFNNIYAALFTTLGYKFIKLSLLILARIKGNKKSYNEEKMYDSIKTNNFYPNGYNRIVHRTKFKINIHKAQSVLNFTPNYHFESVLIDKKNS